MNQVHPQENVPAYECMIEDHDSPSIFRIGEKYETVNGKSCLKKIQFMPQTSLVLLNFENKVVFAFTKIISVKYKPSRIIKPIS